MNTLTDLIQWLSLRGEKTCRVKRNGKGMPNTWMVLDGRGHGVFHFANLELSDVTFKVTLEKIDPQCSEWVAVAEGKPMLPNQRRPVDVKDLWFSKAHGRFMLTNDAGTAPVDGVKYLRLGYGGAVASQ